MPEADDPVVQKVVALAAQEGLIAAIKYYRQAHGCDLRTAKTEVERILAEQGVSVPKAGCAAMLAGVGLGLWFVFRSGLLT